MLCEENVKEIASMTSILVNRPNPASMDIKMMMRMDIKIMIRNGLSNKSKRKLRIRPFTLNGRTDRFVKALNDILLHELSSLLSNNSYISNLFFCVFCSGNFTSRRSAGEFQSNMLVEFCSHIETRKIKTKSPIVRD